MALAADVMLKKLAHQNGDAVLMVFALQLAAPVSS